MLLNFKGAALSGAFLVIVASAVAQQPAPYTYTKLPSASGSVILGYPITVSRDGSLLRQAAFDGQLGYATVNSGNTTFHPLENGSYVMGMNSLLDVVGDDANGHPFIEKRDGTVTSYANITGRTWGLNDAKVLVGQIGDSGYAYSTNTPATEALNFPGAFSTIVRTINNQYNVAGSYWLDGMTHGWTNVGNYETVDFPGAEGTYCSSINYYGHVVGSYLTGATTGMTEGGFYFNGTTFYNLAVPAPAATINVMDPNEGHSENFNLVSYKVEPSSINDFGAIVGGRIATYEDPDDKTTISQVWSFIAQPN